MVTILSLLILETVVAGAKRTKFEDHQRKTKYLMEKIINFWSCDLEKVRIRLFFGNLLISDTVSVRVKRQKFGEHASKKSI